MLKNCWKKCKVCLVERFSHCPQYSASSSIMCLKSTVISGRIKSCERGGIWWALPACMADNIFDIVYGQKSMVWFTLRYNFLVVFPCATFNINSFFEISEEKIHNKPAWEKQAYSCKNNNCWFIWYNSTRYVGLYHINQHLYLMKIYYSTFLCTLGAVWLNYMISFIVGNHIYLLDYRYV